MRRSVDTGLPPAPAPFSHAVLAGGLLFTAHLPVRPDGSVEDGPAAAQTALALANLRQAVEAAGATLDDVAHVAIYLTRLEDKPAVDAVYAGWFRPPYPSRVCVVVSALAVPGARIEIMAYAAVPGG